MNPSPEELRHLLPGGNAALGIWPLHGDGSTRRFFRVRADGATYILLEGSDRRENETYVRIANHLARRGVRVPVVHGVDEGRGWILLEDLGDRSLFAALRDESSADVLALYNPVVRLLCRMQVVGAEGFDGALEGGTSPYGKDVMVQGEGLYFAREFAEGLLCLPASTGFQRDIERLADCGEEICTGYFLHRDFQSRNIHLTPTGPAIIDFQGARPGPLAYDAAALILDPYAGLSRRVRASLLGVYLRELGRLGVDVGHFQDAWFALGTFRLLQALGAFAKLGWRFGKPGFLEHAAKGLELLLDHMGERGAREYPELWTLVARCKETWGKSDGETRRRKTGSRNPRSSWGCARLGPGSKTARPNPKG